MLEIWWGRVTEDGNHEGSDFLYNWIHLVEFFSWTVHVAVPRLSGMNSTIAEVSVVHMVNAFGTKLALIISLVPILCWNLNYIHFITLLLGPTLLSLKQRIKASFNFWIQQSSSSLNLFFFVSILKFCIFFSNFVLEWWHNILKLY